MIKTWGYAMRGTWCVQMNAQEWTIGFLVRRYQFSGEGWQVGLFILCFRFIYTI